MRKLLFLIFLSVFLLSSIPVYSALQIDKTVNISEIFGEDSSDLHGITYNGSHYLVSYWNSSHDKLLILNNTFDKLGNCSISDNTMTMGLGYQENSTYIIVWQHSNSSGWSRYRRFDANILESTKGNCIENATEPWWFANHHRNFDIYESPPSLAYYYIRGTNGDNTYYSRTENEDLQGSAQTTGYILEYYGEPYYWISATVEQDSIGDLDSADYIWFLSGDDRWDGSAVSESDILVKAENVNQYSHAIYTINLTEQGYSNINLIEYDFVDHIWLINDTHGFYLNISQFEESGYGNSSITWLTPAVNNTNFQYEIDFIEAKVSVASNDTCDMDWYLDGVIIDACLQNLTNGTINNVYCNQNFTVGNYISTIICYNNGTETIRSLISFSINLGFTGNTGVFLREAFGLETAEAGINLFGIGLMIFFVLIAFMVGKIWGGILMGLITGISFTYIGWLDITIGIIIILGTGILLVKMISSTFFGEQGGG